MFAIMNFMYVFASILIIFMIHNDGCVNSQSILDQTDIRNPKKSTEKPYNFHPEDRRLEVDEGDGYTISFEEVSNKTRFVNCYYESATIKGNYIINREFEVATTTYRPYPYNQDHLYPSEIDDVEPFLTQSDNSRDKRIPHKKKKGDKQKSKTQFDDEDFDVPETGPNTLRTDSTTCGFVLGDINSRAPRFWTITAFDSYSNKNFTENVTIYFYYNAPLAFKEIYALSGSSYFNYLRLDPNVPIKNCVFTHDGMVFDLELYDNAQQSEYDLSWRGLGDGRCGYFVRDAKLNNPLNLTLRVLGKDNKYYRNTSQVTIIDKSNFFKNREIFTSPTDKIVVHCGVSYEPDRIQSPERFCNLFDPRGNLVQSGDSCNYHIEHVTREDFGTWRCNVGPSYSMDTLSFNTTLKEYSISKELEVDSYVFEHGKYFSLICELLNFKTNETLFCKFTRPDGEIFTTYRGAASPQGYLSHSTSLHEGICGIDITIPGHYEDKGTWKCEINTLAFKTGGFIDFAKSSTPILPQEAPPRPVAVGEKFAVKCVVGFSAERCYIISPNGTYFESEEHYAWFVGECGLTIRHASASDDGTWTCFFTRDSTIIDHAVKVNITVADTNKDKKFPIKAEPGQNFTINCFISEIPLEFCRLFSPRGDGYSFNGTKTTIKHSDMTFRYVGEGLNYGDCIVEIRNVTQDNAGGIWTCNFKIKNIAKTYTHTYDVSVYFEDNSKSLLIFCGIFIVISVYGFGYGLTALKRFYWCGRYKNYNITACLAGEPSTTSQSLDSTSVENVELPEIPRNTSQESPQPGPSRIRQSSFTQASPQETVALIDFTNSQSDARF